MSYKARHAAPGFGAKTAARSAVVVGAAAAAAAGVGVIGADGIASAATAPLGGTASACGTGSSATWNSAGNAVLTVGSAGAGQCGAPQGATYNSAYAQVALDGVSGQALKQDPEPAFVTDNYASGSPRLVIDLNNGNSLVGYPAASRLNGIAMAWAVDNSGTYTDYATAYDASMAYLTTIKDAYVVMDSDQHNVTDTISGITINGQNVVQAPSCPMGTWSRAR
jgi:hypothetical protein